MQLKITRITAMVQDFSLFSMTVRLLVCLLAIHSNVRAFEAFLSSSVAVEFLGQHASPFSPSFFNIVEDEFTLKEQSIRYRRFDVKKKGRASADSKHEVVFAVKQNLDVLEEYVDDIANPFSVNFGKHLTRDQVQDMTYNDDSYQHVLTYLHLHGVEVQSSSKYFDYITASAPISKWEELFSTQFYEFEVEGEKEPLLRADKYSLHSNVHNHIHTVFNTIQFSLPSTPKSVLRDNISLPNAGPFGPILDGFVTPALLNKIYNIDTNTGGQGSQAVYETASEHFSPSDLALFQQTFGLPLEPVATDIGGHNFDGCGLNCGESNLDLQYLMAVSQGTPTTYYWTGANLYNWLQHVAAMAAPPKVISISWGGPESWVLVSDVEAFNAQAIKLAAMGVSLITSSGDDGAPGPTSRNGPMFCGYHAEFPSISQYVTSVGASMGPESGNSPEVVCQSDAGGLITSGGGFSDYFPTPSWQRDDVSTYLDRVQPAPVGGFNGGGRAYPDVSLLGHAFIVAVDGTFVVESGTSASSPVFAGMIALINAQRIASGKSSLGWLNPLLYALRKSFVRDITSGHNRCNVQSTVCCAQGFFATEGWDPVSGLGSVDFSGLRAALVSLGDSAVSSSAPTISPIVTPQGPLRLPPEVSSGWLTGTYYSQGGCEGDVTLVEGLRLGTCFVGFIKGIIQAVYYQYSCDSDYGYVSIFSDSSCTNLALSLSLPLTCAYDVNSVIGGSSSYRLECSSSDDRPLDGVFVVESDNAEVYFGAYLNNKCYPVNNGLSSQSFQLEYPFVFVWSSSLNCSGVYDEFTLVDECLTMFKNDDQDYLYSPLHLERYVKWSQYPAIVPLGSTSSDNHSYSSSSMQQSVRGVGLLVLVACLGVLVVLLRKTAHSWHNKAMLVQQDEEERGGYQSIEMVESA